MGYKTYHENLDEAQAEQEGSYLPTGDWIDREIEAAVWPHGDGTLVFKDKAILTARGAALRAGAEVRKQFEEERREAMLAAPSPPCPTPDELGILHHNGFWFLLIKDKLAEAIKRPETDLTEEQCFMLEAAEQIAGIETIDDDARTYVVTREQIVKLMTTVRDTSRQQYRESTMAAFDVNGFIDEKMKEASQLLFRRHGYMSAVDFEEATEIAREACLRIIFDKATLITNLANHVHGANVDKGWWSNLLTGEDLHGKRNIGELLALMHSEVSEAKQATNYDGLTKLFSRIIGLCTMAIVDIDEHKTRLLDIHDALSRALEAWRKTRMDDKLPHRPGFRVELMDAMIRILDTLGSEQNKPDEHPAGIIFAEKTNFNAVRPDHMRENRRKADGKKF